MAKKVVKAKMRTSPAAQVDAGISLLELIIVLAILGLTATVGVGAVVSWLERSRLDAAENSLRSALQEARFYALIHQDDFLLSLEPEPVFEGRATGRRLPIELSADWDVSVQGDIAFSGPSCTEGAIIAQRNESRITARVDAARCEIRIGTILQ